ncbi:unnamed protein product [Brachionus calyciflorus]|uniref:ADAMTS cysteine-rich domain-containing protein n=1 Tax=Brachionus calyciflorus TaxID=104777 RepID=A0A814B183_9BILA|nr:unnamed protein product [Brachionus calyciflorus]
MEKEGAENCPASDLFIMTPTLSFDKMQNIGRFSSCSIAQLKDYLLENNGGSSQAASCLTNVNLNEADISKSVDLINAGQKFDANDQCKRTYDSSASFCQGFSERICNNLFCRKNSSEDTCFGKGPAVEGTNCDVGKICLKGFCQASSLGATKCIFGDDLILDGTVEFSLPKQFETCENVIKIFNANGKTAIDFCNTNTGSSKCCQTCANILNPKTTTSITSTLTSTTTSKFLTSLASSTQPLTSTNLLTPSTLKTSFTTLILSSTNKETPKLTSTTVSAKSSKSFSISNFRSNYFVLLFSLILLLSNFV